jgi:hypothetical protein
VQRAVLRTDWAINKSLAFRRFFWWRWGDSNPRPLTCEVNAAAGGAQGAIVANADFLGGFALYVRHGKLHHAYSFLGIPSAEGHSHPELVRLLEKTGDTTTLARHCKRLDDLVARFDPDGSSDSKVRVHRGRAEAGHGRQKEASPAC